MTRDKVRYIVDDSPKAEEEFFKQMPSFLYKYRVWENDFHKSVLTKSEIFFSSPRRFNDPYDCGLPFNQDPDDFIPEKIMEKLESLAQKQFPQYANDEVKLKEECAKQLMLIMQAPSEYFQTNYGYKAEDLSKMYGVLSLTPHPGNFLMWSHYSNSHSGFVVGFNTKKLVQQAFGKFKKVNYTDEIPIISMLDTTDHSLMDKLIYTKALSWNYEDEFRITKIIKPDTTSTFTNDTIETIYLGCKMSYTHKIEIIEVVRQKFSHVEVYEMGLSKKSFELIPSRIF